MQQKDGKSKNNKNNPSRIVLSIIAIILALALIGIGVWWFVIKDGKGFDFSGDHPDYDEPIYSKLTGLEITDDRFNSSPTFCVQIPNGSTDGARPQVGLNSAGVVFEAIAETGITRFAAIFQNPDTGAIGPIRSLRPYYLSWDTPFDCTIVHDGGSGEALAEVGNGNYRNLDEDFNYMWKVNYIGNQYRYWNNVFTSPAKLLEFNQSKGYNTSQPQTFPRLTPDEAKDILANNAVECEVEDTECIANLPVSAHHIRTVFSNINDYIVNYNYDVAANTYARSYEGTGQHMSYNCPAGESNISPETCSLTQVAPSALVVMRVMESTMADGYHEQIQTIGNGEAYIFQNGEYIEATWSKSSQTSQIVFRDASGSEIKFTPGQLWIAAVPQFGSVSWE